MSERRLPDMIIAGAPRSGTSWLYELADRHPRIEMAKPRRPEPKFFLDDEVYARGLDYYSKTWFAGIGAEKIAGEKSTNYMESAVAAARMHHHVPAVKLVFVLRDPVERAFSNYRWSRMNGLETEDFETALDLEESGRRALPKALQFARPFAYLERGLYRRLLEPWFERFDRGQILCLRFEDIAADAGAIAERLHRFLGVEPRPTDALDLGVINAAREPSDERLAPATRARLERYYREPNRALAELLDPDFEIWQCT